MNAVYQTVTGCVEDSTRGAGGSRHVGALPSSVPQIPGVYLYIRMYSVECCNAECSVEGSEELTLDWDFYSQVSSFVLVNMAQSLRTRETTAIEFALFLL